MPASFPGFASSGSFAREQAMTLIGDLSVIARIETAMRITATDEPHPRRKSEPGRLADWLARIR